MSSTIKITDSPNTGTTGPILITDTSMYPAVEMSSIPSSATSAAIKTSLMRATTISSANGAWTGTSHGVGGFDRLVTTGSNNFAQSYIHEARHDHDGTGVITEMAFYKAALGTNNGTIITYYGLDYPDLSGVGTVTTRVPINVRDTESVCRLDGYRSNTRSIGTSTYTLKESDSGKVIGVLAGTTVTITCPATIPAGCRFSITALDGNDVTIAAGGGAALLNADSHTKIQGQYRRIVLETVAAATFVMTGSTKA